jgi:hypothetical protein
LKVIVVVPLTFVKFTTLVPLTLKTPVVLNVTGSAFTSEAPAAAMSTSSAAMTDNLEMIDMIQFFSSFPTAQPATPNRLGYGTRCMLILRSRGQRNCEKTAMPNSSSSVFKGD